VRVWVAGCASGEEAYTLAMLASEAFRPAAPPVSIVATDISSAILDKAREARYGKRAARFIPSDLRERYCGKTGNLVEVGRQIRDLVEFKRHNLVADPVPSPGAGSFELIACRNVLIYFNADTVEQVIGLLERGLAAHGMLVLGAADRLCDSARVLARPQPERPRPTGRAAEPPLRRPLGREPTETQPARVAADLQAALQTANEGKLCTTLELTARMLDGDPLDANAYFVRGLAQLGVGDSRSAVASLRRALYVDPAFGLAAFQLARAHEELGDRTAAARAYEQALRTLEPGNPVHEAILDQVDLGDVAVACSLRLRALREAA
jgi:chemotaxis protein methyltransferase CheR